MRHRMIPRVCLAVVLAVVLALSAAAQEVATLEPSTLNIAVGEKKTITLVPASAAQGMTFDFDSSVIAFNASTHEITAKKAGDTAIVGHKGGKDTNSVTITVTAPKLVAVALEKPLIQGEKRPFTIEITNASGETLELTPTVKSANDAIAKVTANNTVEATATSRGDSTTTLNVIANGITLGTIPVTVREAIASLRVPPTFDIEEGKEAQVPVKLIGARGSEFTPEQRAVEGTSAHPILVKVAGNVLQAGALPTAVEPTTEVTFATLEGVGNNMRVEDKTNVTVRVRPGNLVFNPPGAIVPRNGSVRITPELRTRAGDLMQIRQISWTLKNPDDSKYVTLIPTGSALLVVWNDDGPAANRPTLVEIEASARSMTTETPITDTLVMQMVAGDIASNAPLTVQLNIMDDGTARDLYGLRTAEEYYVTRVRLNNNLDAGTPELRGASILAFSESIEVAVRFEKRPVDDRGRPTQKEWKEVTAADVGFSDSGFKTTDATENPVPRCQGFFTYRPYMLEMMVNSVDRRDERSPRTRTFRTLSAIGTLASFITSVAVPGPQSDIPLGIEKFTSLLIPGIEKLWPNLRETHRQNLISQTMKTIEEIPSGSDLSRVLFFPKRSFRGLVQGHETRVSQICPYRFDIEVAVIDKKTPVRAVVDTPNE